MSAFWLLVIAFVALAGMGFFLYQMLEGSSAQKKEKKQRRESVPVPEKDWRSVAERSEKRLQQLEQSVQAAQKLFRDKEKEIVELKAAADGARRHLEQEKTWRVKEEELVKKEKQREKVLTLDLEQTRDALHGEQSSRIKLDHEVKELRIVKESLTMDVHRWSAKSEGLEQNVTALSKEIRELKKVNAEISRKKEADQWVAKDDFVQLEKLLKRARQDIEILKKQVPPPSVEGQPSVENK
jgi:hypothetical protein